MTNPDEARQTEVGHSDDETFPYEDVPSSQVSMDIILTLQVGHPRSNLGPYVH